MARLHFCLRGKGRDIVLNDFLHQFFLFLRTGTRTEHFQIPRRRDDWEGHVSAMMVVFLYWGPPFHGQVAFFLIAPCYFWQELFMAESAGKGN